MPIQKPTAESVKKLSRLRGMWTKDLIAELKGWCEREVKMRSGAIADFLNATIALLSVLSSLATSSINPFQGEEQKKAVKADIEKHLEALNSAIAEINLTTKAQANDVVIIMTYLLVFQQNYYQKHQNIGTPEFSNFDQMGLEALKKKPFELDYEKVADMVKAPIASLEAQLDAFNAWHRENQIEMPDEKQADCLRLQKQMVNDFLSDFLVEMTKLRDRAGTSVAQALLRGVVEAVKALQVFYSLSPTKGASDRESAKNLFVSLSRGINRELESWVLEDDFQAQSLAMVLKYFIAFKQIYEKGKSRQPNGRFADKRESHLWGLKANRLKNDFEYIESLIGELIMAMRKKLEKFNIEKRSEEGASDALIESASEQPEPSSMFSLAYWRGENCAQAAVNPKEEQEASKVGEPKESSVKDSYWSLNAWGTWAGSFFYSQPTPKAIEDKKLEVASSTASIKLP